MSGLSVGLLCQKEMGRYGRMKLVLLGIVGIGSMLAMYIVGCFVLYKFSVYAKEFLNEK